MEGSVLVEIEGANHIANQDNPDRFNEALLNFLESIDSNRKMKEAYSNRNDKPYGN